MIAICLGFTLSSRNSVPQGVTGVVVAN